MQFKNSFFPYLIYAFYTWSIDSGLTPLIKVNPSSINNLPEHLMDMNSILLNIHPNASRNMEFNKDTLNFEAKFNGKSYPIIIHYNTISKIFNREDNYGFNLEEEIEFIKSKPKLSVVKS